MFDCVNVVAKLTLTSETSIFTVNTVMVANSVVRTVNESCLPAVTEQVVQDDGASALAILGTIKWCCTYKKGNTMQYTLPDKEDR